MSSKSHKKPNSPEHSQQTLPKFSSSITYLTSEYDDAASIPIPPPFPRQSLSPLFNFSTQPQSHINSSSCKKKKKPAPPVPPKKRSSSVTVISNSSCISKTLERSISYDNSSILNSSDTPFTSLPTSSVGGGVSSRNSNGSVLNKRIKKVINKCGSPSGGGVGVKNVRKGDPVWFNPSSSTPNNHPQSSPSPDGGNQKEDDSQQRTSPLLLTPGEVIEYHPKGNVLILKSVVDENLVFTIENNAQNVRRRIGELGIGGGAVGYPDMIAMSDLSEPALIWNVRERYIRGRGEIYTYVGSILISVNPYKMFEDIYGLPVVKKYEGKVLGALPPHLFAISSSAYTRMSKDASPQVIIISGESGSGKTEATKLIMGYLALVNKSPSNLITEQILEANPLLESFGNAKTGKNDNSSRFGKYLQVYFNTLNSSSSSSTSSPHHHHHQNSNTNSKSQYSITPIITGCRITEYLLEKSRIVTHNEQERNYHVFYELLRGLSKDQKEKYGLLSAEKYFYLNQGGNCTIQGKNDAEDFQALLSAMQILGFNNDEINNIFKILASILHLGNVYFHRKNLKHGVEGVEIGSDVEVQWIGHLLELSSDGIRKSLTSRCTEARSEKVYTPLTIDQSLDARDAIAKVLYSSLFSWLVQRINRIVFKGDEGSQSGSDRLCINILDIFGFEDFKENNFEQLLINYANESLQHIMNKHIFKLEQAEYVKEKIEWTIISYEDNLPVINLLTKKPVGILHLLDDESNFPKGTDASFLEKCHYNHALSESYTRPRMNSSEFGVKHYAGGVVYSVEGFLEKNRDMVRADVIKLLGSSRCGMISRMFRGQQQSNVESANVFHYHGKKQSGGGGHHPQHQQQRFITMKPRAPTVAARFHDNLTQLLESMSKCSPWFVRCLKPNNSKSPMKFDIRTVSNQLRYSGILETIRIRKLGYPIRYTFGKFANRYKCLVRGSYTVSSRDLARTILVNYSTTNTGTSNTAEFQLGSSKVFLRELLDQRLENARYELTYNAAVKIQSAVRAYLARKRFTSTVHSVVKIQAWYRMIREREKYGRVKNGVVKLQALYRMKKQKSRYSALVKRMGRNKGLCSVTGVNHLEVPAELAFMMSKVVDRGENDENSLEELVKIGKSRELKFFNEGGSILNGLESYSFDKYVRVFFKSNFGMRREPIITPFLKDSPEESLTIFKLILRFMNDPNLSGKREVLLMSYIVGKGMSNPALRDEILVQVLNQTKNNENKLNCDRGWVLLASCLSCFQPSDGLYKYLLNYSFVEHSYAGVLQTKLLQMGGCRGATRALPPVGLEYRGIKSRSQMYVDVDGVDVRVESWSFVEDVAGGVAMEMFGDVGSKGFGLDYFEDGDMSGGGGWKETGSYEFLFDYLNDRVCKSYPFKFTGANELFFSGGGQSLVAGGGLRRTGGPVQNVSKHSNGAGSGGPKSRSMESLLQNNRNLRSLGLSSSKLNERYHSFDNLDEHNQSKKERKLSSDYFDLDEESNVVDLSDEDDDDEDLMDVDIEMELGGGNKQMQRHEMMMRGGAGRVGNPRFIKSTSGMGGANNAPSSSRLSGGGRSVGSSVYGGSRMYIEKGGGSSVGEGVYGMGVKSSAMSDTSEAPSLASHVRRVRVPSQASDVDQFLDDLFSPVLENLDDLSDARSLITSIKGGVTRETTPNNNDRKSTKSPENTTNFLQSAFAQNLQIQQQLIAQNQALQQLLQQTLGGEQQQQQVEPKIAAAVSSNNRFVNSRPPPPPPPLPPSPVQGHRPFIDPYGRAKTVRIGKWRWPPKGEENGAGGGGEDLEFAAFKARVEEARKLDSGSSEGGGSSHGNSGGSGGDNGGAGVLSWPADDDDDEDGMGDEDGEMDGGLGESRLIGGRRVARPFGGEVVGKLKLSNEMRIKLEQVTSVRLGKGEKRSGPKIPNMSGENNKVVKKLDAERRNVLEQKLGGGRAMPNNNAGANKNGFEDPIMISSNGLRMGGPPPPPPPMMPDSNNSHANHQQYHQNSAIRNHHNHHSNNNKTSAMSEYSNFEHSNVFLSSFKLRSAPRFRLRKEVFMPGEEQQQISNRFGEFLKAQVLRDLKLGSFRVLDSERRMFNGADASGLGWKEVVEVAKSWEVYFWKVFRVQTSRDVSFLAISSKGVKLVSVVNGGGGSNNGIRLNVVEFYSWSNIASVTTPKPSVFAIQTHSAHNAPLINHNHHGNGNQQNFFTPQADSIRKLCLIFYNSSIDSFNSKQIIAGKNKQQQNRIGQKQIIDSDVLLVSNNRFIKQQQQQQQSNSTSPTAHTQINKNQQQHHHRFNPQPTSPLPPPPPPPPPLPNQNSNASPSSNSPSPTHMYGQHHPQQRSTSLSSPSGGTIDPYNKPRHHSIDNTLDGSGAMMSKSTAATQYQDDGKHSLLQFAMKYFRQDKFNLASALHDQQQDHGSHGNKASKGGAAAGGTQVSSWTWRDQIGLVKYSPKMLECSLLPMDEEMNRVAMECYASLLKYIGDFWRGLDGVVGKDGKVIAPPPVPPPNLMNNALADVEAVYTLLRNCHNSPVILRDEVYCQIMKQTTNNTSKSAQRAWRLFTILAAYFTCSEVLRPYLFKYLETNAYDKRRAFHGTALVCLQNLRKTFKYGGRRNVPSVEEITAITAGRNAKRQIFRLPGGTQRVVNIKATTVVQDVIDELCGMLNITDPPEAEEFSVYCIVEGDTFTMPLQKEEYILDVTTELQKNQQTFYLIFCRSVWYYPMRLDSNLYIEVVFNQIAPDYLEGLLLTMPGQCLTQNQVYDISKIAALLHRAADLASPPSLKETKYLLPKPALAARDMRPNQWVSLVNQYWSEDSMGADGFSPMAAKAAVLEILASWDLFGSSFFSVKRLADPAISEEYIMALNKNGVHFLDIITHETLNWWSYSEIISTRKVKNEDGILYLDMKTGNLMQTRITRFQTEHAHEISRLIRQYIHIQKYSKGGSGNDGDNHDTMIDQGTLLINSRSGGGGMRRDSSSNAALGGGGGEFVVVE